jgi:hypothetical protein
MKPTYIQTFFEFNSIQFKSLFIRSKDKNTYLMLQVNIKNTLVKFTSYE